LATQQYVAFETSWVCVFAAKNSMYLYIHMNSFLFK